MGGDYCADDVLVFSVEDKAVPGVGAVDDGVEEVDAEVFWDGGRVLALDFVREIGGMDLLQTLSRRQ